MEKKSNQEIVDNSPDEGKTGRIDMNETALTEIAENAEAKIRWLSHEDRKPKVVRAILSAIHSALELQKKDNQVSEDSGEIRGVITATFETQKALHYRSLAVQDVLRERREQENKWSEKSHDMSIWLMILHEETGELAEAVLHHKFGGPKCNNVFKEARQVAGVALQIVECMRRAIGPHNASFDSGITKDK